MDVEEAETVAGEGVEITEEVVVEAVVTTEVVAVATKGAVAAAVTTGVAAAVTTGVAAVGTTGVAVVVAAAALVVARKMLGSVTSLVYTSESVAFTIHRCIHGDVVFPVASNAEFYIKI